MSAPGHYFMDDAREARRLAAKVDPTAWAARYFQQLGGEFRSVLDVGCGPAALLCLLGEQHPAARFTGIDFSSERLRAAPSPLPPNVELRQADATSLPFEDGRFDTVYCRFLLEYLPDRELAVREMARVCSPGGRVMLQDLDGQLVWHYPEDAELQEQIGRVVAGLSKTGFDPFVGRKLFSLARSAGLRDIRVDVEPYHLYAGPIDDHAAGLWELKLDIAMPTAAQILGSRAAAADLKARFLDYLRRDDTITYSVVFTVVGTKAHIEDIPPATSTGVKQ